MCEPKYVSAGNPAVTNILSVNAILFQGNQKNIRVGLSGRNNANSGLLTKKFERFPDYQGD